jgi:hypothetical protein
MNRTAAPGEPLLFKYMSREVGRLVLQNQNLRWSTPRTLNDPRDMQIDLRIDVDYAAMKPLVLQKLWEGHYGDNPPPPGNELGDLIRISRTSARPVPPRSEFENQWSATIDSSFAAIKRGLPELQRTFRHDFANSKILCLSVLPDNSTMWERYSENDEGLAIGFRSVPGIDSPWVTAKPVRYLSETPYLFDQQLLIDVLSGFASLDVKTVMDRVIYTKTLDWAYEEERRIYSGDGRNPEAAYEDCRFNKLELGKVILGHNMPQPERTEFTETIRRLYPHAEISQR